MTTKIYNQGYRDSLTKLGFYKEAINWGAPLQYAKTLGSNLGSKLKSGVINNKGSLIALGLLGAGTLGINQLTKETPPPQYTYPSAQQYYQEPQAPSQYYPQQ